MRRIILTLLAVSGVLFAFFVVTTTMTKPANMPLTLAETVKEVEPSKYQDVIELVLAPHNTIFAYRDNMNKAELLTVAPDNSLRHYLKTIQPAMGESSLIVIRTSEKTGYKTTVDVLDEMVINGIRNYALQNMTPVQEKKFIQEKNLSNTSSNDAANEASVAKQ